MQATLILMIAYSGLGCQNPEVDIIPIPPGLVRPAPAGREIVGAPAPRPGQPPMEPVEEARPSLAPSPYQIGNHDLCEDPGEHETFRDVVRETFWSFVIGRSPDVPSAREIEAAYRSGFYAQ